MISETRIFSTRDITDDQDAFNAYMGDVIISDKQAAFELVQKMVHDTDPRDMATVKRLIGAGIIPTYPRGWMIEYVDFVRDNGDVYKPVYEYGGYGSGSYGGSYGGGYGSYGGSYGGGYGSYGGVPYVKEDRKSYNSPDRKRVTFNADEEDYGYLYDEDEDGDEDEKVDTYTTPSYPDDPLPYPRDAEHETFDATLCKACAPSILVFSPKHVSHASMNAKVRDIIIRAIAKGNDISTYIFMAEPSPRLIYRLFLIAYEYSDASACLYLHNYMADFPDTDEETEALVVRLMKMMQMACSNLA